jgi:diaminopimelate epimerase
LNDHLAIAKYQALGNDFLIVDARDDPGIIDDEPLARYLLDRHFGLGADDLIYLSRSRVADARMRIRTPSGSWLYMCGNGIRCLARYIHDRGLSSGDLLRIETDVGVRQTRRVNDEAVEADMLEPDLRALSIPTTLGPADAVIDAALILDEGDSVRVSCVSVGNPHAVIFVEDLAALGDYLLPSIARHPAFPEGVNAHAVQILTPDRVRIRTWERGAGWTLA